MANNYIGSKDLAYTECLRYHVKKIRRDVLNRVKISVVCNASATNSQIPLILWILGC